MGRISSKALVILLEMGAVCVLKPFFPLTSLSRAAWSHVCPGKGRSRDRRSSFGFRAQRPLSRLHLSLLWISLAYHVACV